jgi:hypothetical protein
MSTAEDDDIDLVWPEDDPAFDDDVHDFELVEEPLAETPLDRFESLTHAQILRALVHRDRDGQGWYAYGPVPAEDDIDGEAHVDVVRFRDHDDAVEWVARMIHQAAIRPDA